MKRRRHTPEQVIRKLRQAERLIGEGKRIPEAAKDLGISEHTYHRWRNRHKDSCLTLVWAVLELYITNQTDGIRFTQLDRQRLKRMRYEGTDHATPEEVTAA